MKFPVINEYLSLMHDTHYSQHCITLINLNTEGGTVIYEGVRLVAMHPQGWLGKGKPVCV